MKKFDLVVIGGGVGGLVAASGASRLGARVALIDKESLGGDCLNWGCVPTKRLAYSAKMAHAFRNSRDFGVECEIMASNPGIRVDFPGVMEGVRNVQEEIGRHDAPERFRKMGIDVMIQDGESGRFTGKNTFRVNGDELWGRSFIIATGSSPVVLPIPGLRESGVLTNIDALQLKELPASITILGAGPIGIEFAQVFSRLGSKVTVIEKAGQILPREDKELSDMLCGMLKEEGIEVLTCSEITEVRDEAEGKVISAHCPTGDKTIRSEEVMIAIGRSPNVEGLGLKTAGVKYDKRRGIKTDATMRTSARHIYAVGDVTGPYAFTHVAEYQAAIALANALIPLVKRKADYRVVPWCTYSDPELARVGATEEEAIKKYGTDKVDVFTFDFKDVDRAVIEGSGRGMIKLVCDRKQEVLGAHILGPRAGELIHEYVLAMKYGIKITEISKTIHVYPTVSQAVKRACDQYYAKKLFTGWVPRLTKRIIRRGGR